ncbi:MAG: nuclear transport factor 2 family protein [Marivibrio sp.]|uniref:nuclear transport factor 2 family protein n=1 Tax=Marivibrio sp. TaxID=2039719 RepID=UPI0032EBE803
MSREEILFANEAFYQAFADGDEAAMDALWARDLPVACLHPGWEPLYERDHVMASWRAVLQDPPGVQCRAPRVFCYGDVAFVICFEMIRDNALIATNHFAKEEGRWVMTHHQAGPTRAAPAADADAPPTIN